jgi:hypothetical protein
MCQVENNQENEREMTITEKLNMVNELIEKEGKGIEEGKLISKGLKKDLSGLDKLVSLINKSISSDENKQTLLKAIHEVRELIPLQVTENDEKVSQSLERFSNLKKSKKDLENVKSKFENINPRK